MNTVASVIAMGLLIILSACAKPQGDEHLQNKAQIEAEGSQKAIDKKALEMEQRLTIQQRFFKGMSGVYQGKFKSGKTTFNVTLIINQVIPVYDGEKIRNIDEINYDLTNLSFNIEDKLEEGGEGIGAHYSRIKPLTDAGYINVQEVGDPVSFIVSPINQGEIIKDSSALDKRRKQISRDLLDGTIDNVTYVQVERRSLHFPGAEIYVLKKVK